MQAAAIHLTQTMTAVHATTALAINGWQLRDALSLIAPDESPEQLDCTICIQPGPARRTRQGIEPAGLFCWLQDYPHEGSVRLDEMPRPADPRSLTEERSRRALLKIVDAALWMKSHANVARQPDANRLIHAILSLAMPRVEASTCGVEAPPTQADNVRASRVIPKAADAIAKNQAPEKAPPAVPPQTPRAYPAPPAGVPPINTPWPEQGGIYIGPRVIEGVAHHIVIPGGIAHDIPDTALAVAEAAIPLAINGHSDWRVGDLEDLLLAFVNAREHFKVTGRDSTYWTRTEKNGFPWAVDFEHGFNGHIRDRYYAARVKPFRSFPCA